MEDGQARPTDESEPTLGVLAGNWAARMSDLTVAVLVSAGILLVAVSAFWPRDVRLTALFMAIASLGAWEAVRRSRRSRPASLAYRAAEVAAAVIGVFSLFVIALSLLSVALGTWIS
ncbi:MAG: hypothetical protein ACT4OZ_06165 [Gemmatimonadota bacterium]